MSTEVWRGPSALDGVTEIVCLISGDSKNRKTGPQLQVYILRADIPPYEAVKQKLDTPICGECPHKGDTCYVLPWQGPRVVWESWKRNPRPMPKDYIDRFSSVRFGAYGDAAALPYEKVKGLAEKAGGFTGFTAQWRTCDQRYANLLMASVSTEAEALEAQAMGWRTYRTAPSDYTLADGEITCPGSSEAGAILTCKTCGYCNGNAKGFRGNVAVAVHGSPAKVKNFESRVQPQRRTAKIEAPSTESVITWL